MERLRDDAPIKEQLALYLQGEEAELKRLHEEKAVGGLEHARLRSRAIDGLIERALAALGHDSRAMGGLAVAALGGYGRQELSPYSDIDLLFLHAPQAEALAQEVCERVLYLLWDLNLELGHSIRTVDECVGLAAEDDPTVITSLMDGRFVAGDRALWDELESTLFKRVLPSISKRYISLKLEELEQRRARFGRSVYLLEPHVKEGEGGLRDIHSALWIAMAKYKVKGFDGLLQRTIIDKRQRRVFRKGLEFLLTIRAHLHYLAGRKEDRLGFAWQEKVARYMGYRDLHEILGVERFMRVYYLHANMITEHSRKLIERTTYEPKVRFRAYTTRSLEDGFFIRAGQLSVYDPGAFRTRPELMMKAFEYADRYEVKISPFVEDLIRENVRRIDDTVRRNPEMNASFLRILQHGRNVADTVFNMNRLRLLGHYMPEFGKIVCLVQHDAYHVYTVDVHSIFMIKEIEDRIKTPDDDTFPLVGELAKGLKKRYLLYLACLLHDIGKGEGKNHARKGALLVPKIAERMGLSKSDTRQLTYLVRRHLVMTHLSQRRDMHDEGLLARFARSVRTLETLRLLYLLTFADLRSVGPDVWTSWKGMLLKELYIRTAYILESGAVQRTPEARAKRKMEKVLERLRGQVDEQAARAFLEGMPLRYFSSFVTAQIAHHTRVLHDRTDEEAVMEVKHYADEGFDEVIFWTEDRVGIFSRLCGVLLLNGLNVLGARIITRDDGKILDVFYVNKSGRSARGERALWEKVEKNFKAAMRDEHFVERALQRRKRHRPLYVKTIPEYPTRIEFDNTSSEHYTVIDIYTHDRPGLLYDITKTLTGLGISIEYARISTKVDQVADVFYVRERDGGKIGGRTRLREIRQVLMKSIDEGRTS